MFGIKLLMVIVGMALGVSLIFFNTSCGSDNREQVGAWDSSNWDNGDTWDE